MPARYSCRDDDHAYAVGSGTTGGRKGMIVSRRGVEAIIEEFGEAFGTPPGDSILIFMPLGRISSDCSSTARSPSPWI